MGALLLGHTAFAQVATDPVGFTTLTCPANADTYTSVPFTRPPEFIGAVSSVSGNTITVSGSPFTANQFVYVAGSQPKTYYVLIGPNSSTNPKEGLSYQVTGNGTNTITVNLNGDTISSVAANTQILVIPYHTLGSLFPASDANVSFIPSTSQFARQTQILIPNYSAAGINGSAAITYYYLNNAWRQFGRPTTEDHTDDAMVNGGYFLVRNAGTGTTFTALGSVLTKKFTLQLFTRTDSQQDNFVSVIRPIDVKLNDLGLITSGAFLSSPSAFNRIDQLLVFDNSQSAQNKSASATYFYYNSAWRKFGESGLPDRGNDVIPAGTGFVIRKGATATGAAVLWQNAPTY